MKGKSSKILLCRELAAGESQSGDFGNSALEKSGDESDPGAGLRRKQVNRFSVNLGGTAGIELVPYRDGFLILWRCNYAGYQVYRGESRCR